MLLRTFYIFLIEIPPSAGAACHSPDAAWLNKCQNPNWALISIFTSDPSKTKVSINYVKKVHHSVFSLYFCLLSTKFHKQSFLFLVTLCFLWKNWRTDGLVFIMLDNGSVCWVLVSEVCYVKAGAMCCLMPLTLMLPSVIVLLVFTGPDQDPATGHFLWAHLSWAMIKTQPLVNFYEHTYPEQWSGNENAQKYDVVCNRTE